MVRSNQRITVQRQIILEEIRKVCIHPTAEEVYQMVRRRLPRVSLGTVYRNLDRLSREGLILRIEGPGQRRYDGDTVHHSHVRCSVCDFITDVDPVDIPLRHLKGVPGDFDVSGYNLEYYGVCGKCRVRRNEGHRTQNAE